MKTALWLQLLACSLLATNLEAQPNDVSLARYREKMGLCLKKYSNLDFRPEPTLDQRNDCQEAMANFAIDSRSNNFIANSLYIKSPGSQLAPFLHEIGEEIAKKTERVRPYLTAANLDINQLQAQYGATVNDDKFPPVTPVAHLSQWMTVADDALVFLKTYQTQEIRWRNLVTHVGKNILHFLADLSTLPSGAIDAVRRKLDVNLLKALISENLSNLRATAQEADQLMRAQVATTSSLPMQPHLTICKDFKSSPPSKIDTYSPFAIKELERFGWRLTGNENALDKEYDNFASFTPLSGTTPEDIKFTVQLPEEAIQNLSLPSEYLLAAKMGYGNFSVCLDSVALQDLNIRTISGQYPNGVQTQRKIWMHSAELTLKFLFNLKDSASNTAQSYVVGKRTFYIPTQNPSEDLAGRNPHSIIRKEILTENWNQLLIPCFKYFGTCARPVRELIGTEVLAATLKKFKADVEPLLKASSTQTGLQYAKRNLEQLESRKKLEMALRAAFELGAFSLYESPKGLQLKLAFSGPSAIPTHESIQKQVFENGRSADEMLNLATERSKKLIEETQSLADEEFVAFLPEISKYLGVLGPSKIKKSK